MARIEPHAEEIIRLYEGGLSSPQIAERYGASHDGVLLLLRRHGVNCRTYSDAANIKWQDSEYRKRQLAAWRDPERREKRISIIRKALRRYHADKNGEFYADLASRVRPEHGRAYHYITEMASGLSASQVAEQHKTTRNAVIGVVWRFQQKHQTDTKHTATRAA